MNPEDIKVGGYYYVTPNDAVTSVWLPAYLDGWTVKIISPVEFDIDNQGNCSYVCDVLMPDYENGCIVDSFIDENDEIREATEEEIKEFLLRGIV